ncbi:MAG: ATP-binding protein [Proteobacteria bacterium]|nr:ATP-binding protein [Pseudomonadota bacterium]
MNAGESTAKYTISTRLIEQVIGQERAVEIVRLAAQQRRFLLLIGEPGTGKSLLGRAVAELLPKASPTCVVALANAEQLSCPRIARLDPQRFTQLSLQAEQSGVWQQRSHNFLLAAAALALLLVCLWWTYREKAAIYLAFAGLGLFLLWQQRRQSGLQKTWDGPKVLYQSSGDQAPFIDATGCSEGGLFGDVRHDPYQSGGRESPPHQLIEVGAVHRAHGGVLYIDEIASLSFRSQRLLLTAIQDKALPITGRQRGSSGTLVQTEAVPRQTRCLRP